MIIWIRLTPGNWIIIWFLRRCIPDQRWVGNTDLFKDTLLRNNFINHTVKVLIASLFPAFARWSGLIRTLPSLGKRICVWDMGIMGCFVPENCGCTQTVYSKNWIIMRNGTTRQYCLHVNTVITRAWGRRRQMKWTPRFAGREPLAMSRCTSFPTLSPCPQSLSRSLLFRAFRSQEKPFGCTPHRKRCVAERYR